MSLLKKRKEQKAKLVKEVKDLTEEITVLKNPAEKAKIDAENAEIKKLEDAKALAQEQAELLRTEVEEKPLSSKTDEEQKKDVDDALKALDDILG